MIKYSVLFLAFFFIPGCSPKAISDFVQGEERVIQQVIEDETGIPAPTQVPAPSNPPLPGVKIVLKSF